MEKATKRIYHQDTEYLVEYEYTTKHLGNGVFKKEQVRITNVIDTAGYKYNLGLLRSKGIESIFIYKIESK